MNPTEVEVTSVERINEREGYQAMESPKRPSWWGVDLDPSRRPGVPWQKSPPTPFPNMQYPPERQQGVPASPMHGRPNKTMPPVFSTSVPLRGLSGLIRKRAYQYADHYPSHWLLLMLGDRVDAWSHRALKLTGTALAVALAAVWVSTGRK
jgi:hypothetical protein